MINIIKKPRWFTAKLHNFFMIGAKGKVGGNINMQQLQGEQQFRRAWYCFLPQKLRSHLSWALQPRVQSWQLYQVQSVSGIEITPGVLGLISCSWFGDFKDTATTVLKGSWLSAALGKTSTKHNWHRGCLEKWKAPLTSELIVGRKNPEEDMLHPFSAVSALLLLQVGCRDLIKFLLLLLWNTDFLCDTLHYISSHAPAQVRLVQEMLSVRASHLVPCPSTGYIPSRFRGHQGAPWCSPGSLQFALLNLTCSKESLKNRSLKKKITFLPE